MTKPSLLYSPILTLRARNAALEAALGWFLNDERFQVGVGGNPNVVNKMIADARAILDGASAPIVKTSQPIDIIGADNRSEPFPPELIERVALAAEAHVSALLIVPLDDAWLHGRYRDLAAAVLTASGYRDLVTALEEARGLLTDGLDLCVRAKKLDPPIGADMQCATPHLWVLDQYDNDLVKWESRARAALVDPA